MFISNILPCKDIWVVQRLLLSSPSPLVTFECTLHCHRHVALIHFLCVTWAIFSVPFEPFATSHCPGKDPETVSVKLYQVHFIVISQGILCFCLLFWISLCFHYEKAPAIAQKAYWASQFPTSVLVFVFLTLFIRWCSLSFL